MKKWLWMLPAALVLSGCTTSAPAPESATQDVAQAEAMQADAAPTAQSPAVAEQPTQPVKAPQEGNKAMIQLTGTIVYKTFEGGFFAFISDNGTPYTLHGLAKEHQLDGLRVAVRGIPMPDLMTTTQFGTVLKVDSVKVIDSSKARAVGNRSSI